MEKEEELGAREQEEAEVGPSAPPEDEIDLVWLVSEGENGPE